MKERRSKWLRALAVIATAMALIALAIVEVLANHAIAEDTTAPWAVHVRNVDDALQTKNVRLALRAWHDAYVAALASRRWDGMVVVGDAYLRIGDAVDFRGAYVPKAREVYLSALFRARQQGSLDGVLRAAEAFAALGDREMALQCLRAATGVAGRDGKAQGRIQALAERFADQSLAAGQFRIEP